VVSHTNFRPFGSQPSQNSVNADTHFPTGINTPHTHPRATEFLTVLEGELKTGFILENGAAQEIATVVKKHQGTVFPQGSIHFQFNDHCEKTTFLAALNSDDPGTSQIAQNFFGLNAQVVEASLGGPVQVDGKDIELFRDQIPLNLAQDVRKCLKKCEGY
jgi:oxalate decarboxylase/phosphoglucose isomerase-like protein (cupin superfamily)